MALRTHQRGSCFAPNMTKDVRVTELTNIRDGKSIASAVFQRDYTVVTNIL